MNKTITFFSILSFISFGGLAQSNYLDSYINTAPTLTVIATSTDQLNQPRDLDFKPNTNELWVCNNANGNGGSMVIFYNAGWPNVTSEYRKDTHSDHFMIFPSAMAFGENGKWAAVSEIQNTNSASPTFMGPALWSGDTSVFARVFQNNWVAGLPLGSHLDMLHQSPFAMGIAYDSANIYWVMDGYNGNICKYDYVMDHGPGYDDHSAGKIWRYSDVTVSRVPQVPSHMVLDKSNGWLYFIDGGNRKVKRMNVNSGNLAGTITPPSSGNEALAGYYRVLGATVETLDSLGTQPCGMDYYNGRLIVSDYSTGDIYLNNTIGTFSILDTIVTGHPGMMGIKVGPDGHIWCVNKPENKVYRLDVAPLIVDLAVSRITVPQVENYLPGFYSTAFNVCDGSISPAFEFTNVGSATIDSFDCSFYLDGNLQYTYHRVGSLSSYSTVVIFPNAVPVSNGSHFIDLKITSVNGGVAENELNNRMTGSFRAFDAPVSLPFSEGFSSSTFPPPGWNYIHYNPNNTMSRSATGGFGLSTGSILMDNYSGYMNITGQQDYLMLPIIDMTPASPHSWLSFNVAHARYDASISDTLRVLVSSDCGTTWNPVYTKYGAALATAPNNTMSFTPSASQWRKDSANLSAYAGQPEVLIMLNSISSYGNNIYIDDIFVGDLSTGISKLTSKNEMIVFPNPASSSIQVSFTENFNRTIAGSVYSFDGKLMKSFVIPASENSVQLDVSDLASGMYAVRLNSNQQDCKKIFIKQ